MTHFFLKLRVDLIVHCHLKINISTLNSQLVFVLFNFNLLLGFKYLTCAITNYNFQAGAQNLSLSIYPQLQVEDKLSDVSYHYHNVQIHSLYTILKLFGFKSIKSIKV